MNMKLTLLAVSFAAAAALVSSCATGSKDVVYPGKAMEHKGNPIFTDTWTADPAPVVVGNRVYVYTGHDDVIDGEKNDLPGGYKIVSWRCYSSDDLYNWISHGDVLRPEQFPNGLAGSAWAAQVAHKNGKFYYYCTFRDTKNGGNSIGVAVADSPVGPFVPQAKPVVIDSETSGRSGWNDIDPTVLIDDDGTAWLAWGHTNCYLAKLKDNMIEKDGEIIPLQMESYIEGPWLYKRKGLYYMIYAGRGGQGGEAINYATAEKITGPWTYRGRVAGSSKNSFTSHPGVVDFKGRTFFFTHNGMLDTDGRKGGSMRRSVCMDEMFFNEDGTIKEVVLTDTSLTAPVK